MEVGSLFNSGILGQSFNWWMGQIADDSTWRENINPGKFENKEGVPGWGYRYKVRIMGLHDRATEVIESEELPWATVMYPITSGGGQAGAFATLLFDKGMWSLDFLWMEDKNKYLLSWECWVIIFKRNFKPRQN